MFRMRSVWFTVMLFGLPSCYFGGALAGEELDQSAADDAGKGDSAPPSDSGKADDADESTGTGGAGQEDTGSDTGVDTGGDTGGPTDDGSAVQGNGLPCEVEELLVTRCQFCHGDPASGAPNSLVTHADLIAPSLTAAGLTMAEVSVERMRGNGPVMPPGAGPTIDADPLEAFAAWVDSGMPAESCPAD